LQPADKLNVFEGYRLHRSSKHQPVHKCSAEFGFMDTCKTNVLVSLFRAKLKKRFVSGHDFSRAVKAANDEGFSP
jgi:hypothetical protein